MRGGILDIYPATEERAVRVELFGDEVESLRWFSTFTQRSLADAQRVEIAPAAELGPEYRELAEMAAEEESEQRPDVAEVLPVDRFRSFLDLVPDEATVVVAAEEELRPALADHWQDVTTSLHSDDAHDLYLPPEEVGEVLERRANVSLLRGVRGPAAPVPRAGGRHRGAHDHRGRAGAGEARALRLRRRWSRGTGAARPSAPPTTSRGCGRGSSTTSERLGEGLWFAQARLREGFIAPQLKLAVIPDHRLLRRRRAERPEGTRGRAFQAFTELRPGDVVVHTDHGIGRFTGFDTKTVANVTRDYLEVEYRDGDRVFVPTDQLDRLLALRRRGRRGAGALEARLQDAGTT